MEKKSKSTVPVNAAAAVEAVAAADMEEDVEAAAMAAAVADMAAEVEDTAAVVEDMAEAVEAAAEDIVEDVVVEVDSAEDEEVVVAVDVAVVITAIKMATLPENAPNKDRSATRSILSIIHGRGVPPY